MNVCVCVYVSVRLRVCVCMYTVIYRLIAAATITFSKLKGVASKQGQLLYEGGH